MRSLRNEKVTLTTTLITKLLTNPPAPSPSTADAGDQSPHGQTVNGMEEVSARVTLAPQIDTLGLSIQISGVSGVVAPSMTRVGPFAGTTR
jgi:hypothetical protein